MYPATTVMYDHAGYQRMSIIPATNSMSYTSIDTDGEDVTTAQARIYDPDGTLIATKTPTIVAASTTADLYMYIEDLFEAAEYPTGRNYRIEWEFSGVLSDSSKASTRSDQWFDVVSMSIGNPITAKQVWSADPDLALVNAVNTEAEMIPYIRSAYELIRQRLRSMDHYEDLVVDGFLWGDCIKYQTLVLIYRSLGDVERAGTYSSALNSQWSNLTASYRYTTSDDPSVVNTATVQGRRSR